MYEYKVVPAPSRGQKARGVKGAEARFAYALEQVMNQLAADGWDYVRAETLPSEERQGLTGTATHYRNVLVFRRPVAVAEPQSETRLLPVPDPTPLPADPPLTAKPAAEDDAADDDETPDPSEEDDAASDEDTATDDDTAADDDASDADKKPA